ncbi:hypothetical protein BpHYR1_021886 [Brachionus plicatilis]|uniref:Uncharacterized protein n=1 Tax=Brachionus plicatilis TaxID=10195 RepID=A0A3M7SME1_BRAPC|nr:hypothetical protein BpHYR1_021886 [Brachionus plicatilis]
MKIKLYNKSSANLFDKNDILNGEKLVEDYLMAENINLVDNFSQIKINPELFKSHKSKILIYGKSIAKSIDNSRKCQLLIPDRKLLEFLSEVEINILKLFNTKFNFVLPFDYLIMIMNFKLPWARFYKKVLLTGFYGH